MGISFKVSKKGTRFRPKPTQLGTSGGDVSDHSKEGDDSSVPEKRRKSEHGASDVNGPYSGQSTLSNGSEIRQADPGQEVSFSLNLFPNGFSIGTPSEKGKPLPLLQDAPKLLYPYNRASETLFSAIECGFLPGDILDDIPCKYLDGKLLCEVRDYRKCVTTPGNFVSGDGSPIVHRVCLRMSTENVVKDMPSITAASWSYGDLLEVESRIVKALQPELCLNPVPLMDRLSADPVKNKLNLGMNLHRKRTRQAPSVQVLPHNLSHGKKVSTERVGENDKSQLVLPSVDPAMQRPAYNVAAQSLLSPSFRIQNSGQDFSRQAMGAASQPKYQTIINNSKSAHDQASNVTSPNASAINTNFVPGTGQDVQNSYKDPRPSLGKREGQCMQMPSNFETKRPRQEQVGLDGIHTQHAGSQMDYPILGADSSWKSTLLQQQFDSKRNANIKHPQQAENDARQTVLPGVPKPDGGVSYADDRGVRYNVKVEQPEVIKLERHDASMTKDDQSTLVMEPSHADSQMQPRQPAQQSFMRFPSQSQWHNLGNFIEKDLKKEDASQRRKQAPTSRVSGGTMENSPVSSKSGELSSGSFGAHYNMNTQKEKTVSLSDTATGATSVSSCLADAGIRQNHMSGKRKQVPLARTPTVGSPPFNANSPSIGTPPILSSGPKLDAALIEKFSKLEAVAQRHGLHCKKNKVDECHERKPLSHSADLIVMHLSTAQSSDDANESMCTKSLSKSLLGGSMNVCKTRILDCVRTKQIVHANGVAVVTVRNKLFMSERVKDGMVEAVIQYGDEDESSDLLSYPQDALPTLPNTHYADLFGEQFAKLMIHDGYEVSDQIQTQPGGAPSGSTSSASLGGSAHDTPYQQPVSGHTAPSTGIMAGSVQPMNPLQMPSQNLLPGSRMQHAGVVQAPPSHVQSGYLPSQARQQHLDPSSHLAAVQPPQQSPLQQQQHQYSQLQRAAALGQNSPLTQLNAVGSPVGNQMVSSSSNLQLQLLQQQHQQQQQSQQQQQQQPQIRKVMGALPGMGMPNMGSGMVSGPMQPTGATGGLGNFVGLGGIGMGMGHMGPNISAPMGSISGLSNISQMGLPASSVSNVISQQIRLNPAHASTMVAKLRMMQQNRGRGMLGPTSMRSPIDSLGGIPGTGPMSMLGQTLNRTSMGSMQRAPMAGMGPPKIPGTNFYMNQQQQFQQQQQQLQQPQQMLQQQQQLSSPLQQSLVGSVQQQVSSPSGLTVQQQMNPQSQLQPQPQSQPQQQISPQQLSQQTALSPPQQLSSGAVQQLVAQQQVNVAGPGAGPASPQLSSQTMGSVGSITSSPMDLQGGSKSNSNINTN